MSEMRLSFVFLYYSYSAMLIRIYNAYRIE